MVPPHTVGEIRIVMRFKLMWARNQPTPLNWFLWDQADRPARDHALRVGASRRGEVRAVVQARRLHHSCPQTPRGTNARAPGWKSSTSRD